MLSIVFAGTGTGNVRSADGTIACSSACSKSLAADSGIELIATAAPGSRFTGWSGACASTDHCRIALAADAAATATFVADPPPYNPTGYLVVRRSGAGRITSDRPGIDCGFDCNSYFSSYGPVTLTATPASGFAFTRWGGACSGSGACVVQMGSVGMNVTAEFEHVQPLPDGCANAMPQSIPAPVTFDPGGTLMEATSDGTGENFLFTVAPDGLGTLSRDYYFVRIRGRIATQLALRSVKYQNDATTYSEPLSAESQPLGFDVFRYFDRDALVDVYAPDGTLLRTGSVMPPLQPGETSQNAEYAIPPGGGIATMRWVWNGTSSYTIHYGRFDAQGVQVVDTPIDQRNSGLAAWGVNGNGNVLLVGAQGPGGYGDHALYGRWLDERGAPLTDWFSAGTHYIRNRFLLPVPSGLALGDDDYYSLVFPDAEAVSAAAAGWLNDRAEQHVQMVRGGFVSFGVRRYGSVAVCGEGIEVLTTAGVSCGCLTLPEVLEGGYVQSVGRDGSVFAQRYLPSQPRSVFEVYPGLFR